MKTHPRLITRYTPTCPRRPAQPISALRVALLILAGCVLGFCLRGCHEARAQAKAVQSVEVFSI